MKYKPAAPVKMKSVFLTVALESAPAKLPDAVRDRQALVELAL
jgi:hypothetical protein